VRVKVLRIIAFAMLTAACGSLPLPATVTPTPSATLSPSNTPQPASTGTPKPTAAPTPVVTVQGLAAAPSQAEPSLLAAAAHLAERLELPDGAEVRVKSVTAREWPDASLGCPQPGMVYAQVITPGYEVAIEVAGEEYIYHTDKRGNAVACEERATDGGKDVDRTVQDGNPSQPKELGNVDTSRITPVPKH